MLFKYFDFSISHLKPFVIFTLKTMFGLLNPKRFSIFCVLLDISFKTSARSKDPKYLDGPKIVKK